MINNSGKNNPNYRNGRYCTKHYCACGKEIDKMGRSMQCTRCRNINNNPFKGKTHSKEARKIIGEKSRAKFTDEFKERVYRSKAKGNKSLSVDGYILVRNYTHQKGMTNHLRCHRQLKNIMTKHKIKSAKSKKLIFIEGIYEIKKRSAVKRA